MTEDVPKDDEADRTGTTSRVASAPRNVYGPRPVGALVPALTRPAFRRQGPAAAQVLADWAAIVGPSLAAITQPRRLWAGTLSIGCSGPVAMELQHLAPELMARINAQLGAEPVQRLRFVQGAPRAASAAPPTPSPSPAAVRAAETAVEPLPAGPLRDALASLGRAVLTPRPTPRPLARQARRGAKPAARLPTTS